MHANLDVGIKPLDPLDDSNSLSDLARSMHHMQPSPAQSASAASSSVQPAAHGPLVQLMHSIAKVSGAAEPAATSEGIATDMEQEDGNRTVGADETVNLAAGVSLAHPQDFEEEADLGGPLGTDEGPSSQHCKGGTLPVHGAQVCGSAGYAQGQVAARDKASEVDGGSELSRHDTIPIRSAQDFFQGRG